MNWMRFYRGMLIYPIKVINSIEIGCWLIAYFLIASPWSSFSLTLILIALIGIYWTLAFIVLSMLIAILTGYLFDVLVARVKLPSSPQQINLPGNYNFWFEAKKGLLKNDYSPRFFSVMIINGVKDSRMVVRWNLFGVLLASLVRILFHPSSLAPILGQHWQGLG
jgi:uncharacterized membrane protein YraQ (UPF0718 family)